MKKFGGLPHRARIMIANNVALQEGAGGEPRRALGPAQTTPPAQQARSPAMLGTDEREIIKVARMDPLPSAAEGQGQHGQGRPGQLTQGDGGRSGQYNRQGRFGFMRSTLY